MIEFTAQDVAQLEKNGISKDTERTERQKGLTGFPSLVTFVNWLRELSRKYVAFIQGLFATSLWSQFTE